MPESTSLRIELHGQPFEPALRGSTGERAGDAGRGAALCCEIGQVN
jgi:hypothetical protein